VRGLFENGIKITDSKIKRVLINNNPNIGRKGAKMLIKSLANDIIEHIELRNINASVGTANLIANFIRDPYISWKYCDFSQNSFSRIGLNEIFWGMIQNKRIRILKLNENKAGLKFNSVNDNLLSHGISVPQFLRNNVILRELDLSYNALSTEAGLNILDALIDNHTLKKISLRGNVIEDSIASVIPDLLRCNNVLEELDLGKKKSDNKVMMMMIIIVMMMMIIIVLMMIIIIVLMMIMIIMMMIMMLIMIIIIIIMMMILMIILYRLQSIRI